MRIFWQNGAICAEPETHVEAEAILLLLRGIHYDLPDGYCEDGRDKPQIGSGGSGAASDLLGE